MWGVDKEAVMIVLRQVIGDELRRRRQDQGRTLRDVSGAASVSAASSAASGSASTAGPRS